MRQSNQILVVVTIIAVALIVCAWILAGSLVRVKSGEEIIRVTGSARKSIRADFITWRARIAVRGAEVGRAYQELQTDLGQLKVYLLERGVPESEIIVGATETKRFYARSPKEQQAPPEGDVEQ